QPLGAATRAFMEARFGHDFSRVQVHTDAAAAAAARAVSALAYTVGSHVVFGAGQYAPRTSAGRQLLAHELAHVLQQRSSAAPPADLGTGDVHDPAEAEADRLADQVLHSPVPDRPAARPVTQTPAAVRRTPDGPPGATPARTGPQQVGQDRIVTLPTFQRGQ